MFKYNLERIKELLENTSGISKEEAYAEAVKTRLNKSLDTYYKSLVMSSEFLSRKNELRVVKRLSEVE